MTKRLSLRSDGCEDIIFFCKHSDIAKRVVHAFSNMQLTAYRRLIADAVGTSEQPCFGEIVHTLVSRMDENGHPSLRRHYGRLHLGVITLFPTSDERRAILRDVVLGSRVGISDVRVATMRSSAEEAEIIAGENALAVFQDVIDAQHYTLHLRRVRDAFPDNVDAAVDAGTVLLEEFVIPTRERSIDLS